MGYPGRVVHRLQVVPDDIMPGTLASRTGGNGVLGFQGPEDNFFFLLLYVIVSPLNYFEPAMHCTAKAMKWPNRVLRLLCE